MQAATDQPGVQGSGSRLCLLLPPFFFEQKRKIPPKGAFISGFQRRSDCACLTGHGAFCIDAPVARSSGRACQFRVLPELPGARHRAEAGLRGPYRKMKIKNSVKALMKRHRDNRMVRRRGRIYIINKTVKRYKARQG